MNTLSPRTADTRHKVRFQPGKTYTGMVFFGRNRATKKYIYEKHLHSLEKLVNQISCKLPFHWVGMRGQAV